MDVTSENFAEAVARLEAVLPGCAFVAFDEEMTGIHLNASTVPAMCDTAEQRYAKMRRVASEFTLMQVGICVFTAEEGGLVAHPFNFYVCPDAASGARLVMHVRPPAAARARAAAAHARRRTIAAGARRARGRAPQASTAGFHRDNHFDFNKWLYHGVPYLTFEAYERGLTLSRDLALILALLLLLCCL